jgi:hypothetical protein
MSPINLNNFGKLLRLAAFGAALAGCATAPQPVRAEHPHYLHALSDLRTARALLDHPDEYNVAREQFHAIDEIDRAIGEIKRASIDDGKPLDYHPPVDTHLDQRGRLHQARDLIDSAHRDLSFAEDNMAALGWRDSAIHHVDLAHGAVDHAIRDKHWDNKRLQ